MAKSLKRMVKKYECMKSISCVIYASSRNLWSPVTPKTSNKRFQIIKPLNEHKRHDIMMTISNINYNRNKQNIMKRACMIKSVQNRQFKQQQEIKRSMIADVSLNRHTKNE